MNQVKFSGKPGSSAYAARRIGSSTLSAFQILIDKSITDTIVNSTNQEAENNKDSFRITFESLYFLLLFYFVVDFFVAAQQFEIVRSRLYGVLIISELMSKS